MELFKIFGSIIVDDKKALASLKKTDQEAYNANVTMNKIGETGKKIGKAVAIGASVVGGAMAAITTKTVKTLDDIDKASQRAGMGAEEFQRWGHVAGLNGIEMGKFESAAIKNQRAMAQASQGAGKAADSYKALGINIKGLTSDQVFEKVILELSDMENETERNAIANDIFGKSFADLAPLLNSGSAEISAMKGELDDLGAVMSEDQVKAGAALNDTMDRVKKMFGAVALGIGSDLIPYFEKFGQWILDNKEPIIENFQKVFDKIRDGIQFVIEKGDILIPILGGILGGVLAFKVLTGISALFSALSGTIALASSAGGVMNLVMAANPLALVAIGISVVIAAGIALYKNWDKITAAAGKLWGGISDTFGKVGTFIGDTMSSAQNSVKNAVDKIKGFFNFKWSFPKLRMPHFKVSGSVNPLNWLKDGVPKIGVDWYAKGGIMTKPTAFGMNGNNLQVGGEAGQEAILPLTTNVLSNIGKGIASTMPAQQQVQVKQDDRPIILQVDGKTFAQLIGDYTGAEGGQRIRRIERGLA